MHLKTSTTVNNLKCIFSLVIRAAIPCMCVCATAAPPPALFMFWFEMIGRVNSQEVQDFDFTALTLTLF